MLIPKKVRIHLNLIALTRELCTNRLYSYLTVLSRSNYNNPLVFRNNGQFPIYTKVSLLAKRIESSFFFCITVLSPNCKNFSNYLQLANIGCTCYLILHTFSENNLPKHDSFKKTHIFRLRQFTAEEKKSLYKIKLILFYLFYLHQNHL